jgi:hypothetical protein
MIVSEYPDGDLQIACQTDHALLSGQIARAWRRPAFLSPRLWEEFAIAVDHHDDGWKIADADPVLDAQGRPGNFRNTPTHRHIATWQHTLDQAITLGDYPRLLIASHARWLFTTLPTVDDNARDAAVYMTEQLNGLMSELLTKLSADSDYALAVDPHTFDLSQKLFSFFDALSLVFLRGLDWISRTDPLPFGDEVASIRLHSEMCSPRWGRLTPWPFVEDDVAFRCPIRRIPGQTFRDSVHLHETLEQTPAKDRWWRAGRL